MSTAPPLTCPVCGGSLGPNAVECPHCGERLVGDATLPADAASLRHELDELKAKRRRYNMLGFALGVPGILLQAAGGAIDATEQFDPVVGLLVQVIGLFLLAAGLYHVALYKGRNGAWALLSLIGCIGLIVLLILKDFNAKRMKEIEAALGSLGHPAA